MNTRIFLASALLSVLALAACGGDQKHSKSPESSAGITETSAKEDMPPPPAKEGDATTTPAAGGDAAKPAGGPAGGVIKVAAMKLTPAKKGKNDKTIELKDDGSVNIDGKPAAKIKGDTVDSTGGTSMVTVGIDGSLVGNGVKPGYKFEGDDLVHENGSKLSVGEDGTITQSSKDGKSDAIGKAEGGGSAKRAALIAAVLWMTIPDAGATAAAGAKKGGDAKKGDGAKPTSTAPKK